MGPPDVVFVSVVLEDLNLARRVWAGLRPMMPSMLPRVGPGRRAGVFYNTGHGHLGWTLSAATAGMVADAVNFSSRTVKPRLGFMLGKVET